MQKIDLLIKNANIITLDISNSRAGSLAVSKGKIVNIWREKEPAKNEVIIDSNTEIIDLKGNTLLPGFIDTHNHLLMYSQFREQVNCSSPLNRTISNILERIKEVANEKEKNEWIMGWGYDDTLLEEKRHPTRSELDRVAPDHPVFIRHISGHFATVNSKALQLANIQEEIGNPRGGFFGRDHNGRLDGVLHELPAMEPIMKVLPVLTEERLTSVIEKGAKDYLAQGITTSTDAGVGLDQGITEFNAHVRAVSEGKNPLRMRLMVLHHLLRKGSHFGNYSAQQLDRHIRHESNNRAVLDSAKLFQDGSIQGLTGALRHPYFCNNELIGELLHEQQEFTEEILDLHDRGFRIAIHGNGDRAIGSILDAYSKVLHSSPRSDHRHRIEHVQTATLEDLDRMEKLGVEASFFINHIYYWGERHRSIFLGEERAQQMNPLKSAIERDIKFTLHSDCPITPISPLFSIWAAVNRVTSAGNILGANQRCDMETALKSMTIYGARLNFEEHITGSIEIGKQADFAVLTNDPTLCNPIEIKDIVVTATMINGKVVYESPQKNYTFS
ncbi:amidohydrolase [Anaerobacillus sp. MEB173]|uniref:amidohydrolase n=1 Tax=Anaerobacillus sp. MEB173 TaxID=3383345 RepID=UPI003F91C8A2